MRRIGVDQALAEVYESAGNYWRIKLPPPLITGAILDPSFPPDFSQGAQCVFREDDFDFAARIRRGRFYTPSPGQQPSVENVLPRNSDDAVLRTFQKSLFVYDDYQLSPITGIPKLVALGSYGSFSIWQIAAPPERISTGEFIFVLRARHSFGVIPDIDEDAVPEQGRAKVLETLEKLVASAHRESAGSVLHLARDAAQWCLATWASDKFKDETLLVIELGPLIQKIEKRLTEEGHRRDSMVALRAAEILQRFHSREKPSEQKRRGLRPPMESDAELAISSIGFLLRELGWARR